MKYVRLLMLFVFSFIVVQSVSAQGGSGPVTGFAGGFHATTGQSDLFAISGCPTPTNCTLAAPATWIVSSSAGWTVTEVVPTSIFSFVMPNVGHQTINVEACNQFGCFEQDREIGPLDSSLVLTGLENPINLGQPYQLSFEATTVVVGGGSNNIQMYLDVNFPYAGTQLPQLSLEEGTVSSCERSVSNGTYSLGCQVIIPRNSTISGYVSIPADHAQTFFFNTCWTIEHNYFQPGTEIEYPYDGLNTPCAYYGGDAVFLPFLTR